ncbi:DegT/DnrJ/EryC1/StrS family aminotransferase [Methylomonas fluvii]|uniref:DegT/DnrJ/EryC1/StrS family aminotransferase n=1 Tax=Methylomonas fluvii TaxID=1854564 RepID=A0ABR9DII2_9GAMM|nr:DegT/DnrJ/EryC1/StrS family aminotransferase [Methylomonas fluvii]MBD9362049.1 DegT/DnrJ/EryC1/StrS family aminotransferase [Methylomonas fluvii]CAD6875089.1 hypothetical protein [Methylomonas fluvii]
MDKHNSFLVPYVGLKQEFEKRKNELLAAFVNVGESASYILREDVKHFEVAVTKLLGVRHAIAVNSGTDALFLALKALNIGRGDEVITVAHTFVATISAIVHSGAKPILVDIADDFNMSVELLRQAIGPSTKAIIPVHMNGRCCDMRSILAVAEEHDLSVIEDAAQSMGAQVDGVYAGNFGVINAFSLHPMKNLHCYGDGGFITTNDSNLADRLLRMRNHGQSESRELLEFGFNSRLDNLQAALLNVNFKYFHEDTERRRAIALRYHSRLSNCEALKLPRPPQNDAYFDVFSSYPIRCVNRDKLRSHLFNKGIECFTHWDKPLHKNSKIWSEKHALPMTESVSREVLSLPMHPFLSDEQCDYVISVIREFF